MSEERVELIQSRGSTRWDPVSDRLIDTSPPPMKAYSEAAVLPDPAIAEAQAAYHAALAAARPPEPVRKTAAPTDPNSGRPKKRPGFA